MTKCLPADVTHVRSIPRVGSSMLFQVAGNSETLVTHVTPEVEDANLTTQQDRIHDIRADFMLGWW